MLPITLPDKKGYFGSRLAAQPEHAHGSPVLLGYCKTRCNRAGTRAGAYISVIGRSGAVFKNLGPVGSGGTCPRIRWLFKAPLYLVRTGQGRTRRQLP